ncbi:MAG: type II toxin-antitoxin system PemK/MazF family toxin [Bacillota bacterium]|nr:type II toxin-antitoxin system PemK/MazF family toxin [Bacillota bacterium]
MVGKYTPEQGDIILLNFNPQSGHKQKGKRPVLVATSNQVFNNLTNVALVCPITRTKRAFPLHVALGDGTKTVGYVMCEQVKSLDLAARKVQFFEKAPPDVVEQVVDILYGIIERVD